PTSLEALRLEVTGCRTTWHPRTRFAPGPERQRTPARGPMGGGSISERALACLCSRGSAAKAWGTMRGAQPVGEQSSAQTRAVERSSAGAPPLPSLRQHLVHRDGEAGQVVRRRGLAGPEAPVFHVRAAGEAKDNDLPRRRVHDP